MSSVSALRSGSHSAPLASTRSALAAALTWLGNPAPPAPTTPALWIAVTVVPDTTTSMATGP
jgi:hypothetical protein